MATVFTLLSFPKTSDGFTALRSTSLATTILDEGSESSARKVARSATDSDSASAFRSKQASIPVAKPNKSISIQIVGEYKSPTSPEKKFLTILDRCIKIVFTRGLVVGLPATHEEIYSACRYIVTVADRGRDLYDKVKAQMSQALRNIVSELVISSRAKDVSWISAFNEELSWFRSQTNLLRSLFTYLDQSFVFKESGLLNIRDLSDFLCNEEVFGHAGLAVRLRACVKEWMDAARAGRILPNYDAKIIPTLIDHLVRHHQYSNFEEYYLECTRAFYLVESASKADLYSDQPAEFFNDMYAKIESEVKRAEVLQIPSWNLVRETAEVALWTGRAEWLANSITGEYFDNREFESLRNLYNVFNRIGATEVLVDAFRSHITNSVSAIVKDVDRESDMVQRLLDFKAVADNVITSCFTHDRSPVNTTTSTSSNQTPAPASPSTSRPPPRQVDQAFVYALSGAFTVGFKSQRSRPTEMLAQYVDKAMRKGQGQMSDAEFQHMLDKALELYRFTDDKDVFRTFYHRGLAKRLLLDKSASDDFEKAILKKLKDDYDPEFGMAEEMFKDLALSKDLTASYHNESNHGLRLSVSVLKRSAWPFSGRTKGIIFPPEMQKDLDDYTSFYVKNHKHRILEWNDTLGSMTLNATFRTKIKEIDVSLYQGIVLLLFNEADEISFVDLQVQTDIEDGELRRTLQSLACGKKRVLKKIPPSRDVNDDDVFRFNADFDDIRRKFHINSIQAKTTPEESRRTNKHIESDRQYYLDAAIVRIMKSKKEMTYEQLKAATIDEVIKHFNPRVEDIKKRVEALVEQEYLERSPDKNKFLYVA